VVNPTSGGKDGVGAERSDAQWQSEADTEIANPRVELQQRSYDAHLLSLEQRSEAIYDKAVVILSGGALGLSLVVVKDYLRLRGGGGSGLIALALLCWALSVSCILFSSPASRKILRSALPQADGVVASAQPQEGSDRVAAGLRMAAGLLFFVGAAFFATYVAIEPPSGVKQQPVSTAPEEIARFLSLYDSVSKACPDCSTVEVRKVLQACEGSYLVPDVLREACPRCTEKGILQLNHDCMEKWNSPRRRSGSGGG
jgi:hypothetical protein